MSLLSFPTALAYLAMGKIESEKSMILVLTTVNQSPGTHATSYGKKT